MWTLFLRQTELAGRTWYAVKILQYSNIRTTATSTSAQASEQREDNRTFLLYAKCSGTLNKSLFCA